MEVQPMYSYDGAFWLVGILIGAILVAFACTFLVSSRVDEVNRRGD